MLKALNPPYFLVLLLILFGSQVFAQNYQLSGNYYIRSSMDFYGDANKVGVLQQGSTFRVVNRFPKRGGAEALEIEITALSGGSHASVSPSGKFYIYKPASGKGFINRATGKVEAGIAACENCETQSVSASSTISLTRINDRVVEMVNTAPSSYGPHLSEKNTSQRFEGQIKSGSLDQQIKNYSSSKEVSRMIDWAMKNKSPKSRGICYRKVKEALATQCGNPRRGKCENPFTPEGGKNGPGNNLTKSVSTEWADSYALSAKTRLKKEGFVNLLEVEPYKSQMLSPTDAPKGAVLVYSSGIPCNGQKDCGHSEIKTGNPGEPGYVSDYYSKDAINETPRARKYGSNYTLVGIMIKPKDTP